MKGYGAFGAILGGIAIASLTVVTSFAGPRDGKGMPADANGDGEITRAEAEAAAGERFDAADANGDGKVTKEEMKQARKNRGAERFAKLDKNGNGTLSKDELPKKAAERFDKIDANSDGEISKSEMKAQRGKHRGGNRHCDDEKGG